MSARSLPLLLALASASAAAADAPPLQKIVYELAMNGQKIGTRELSIRYLPREDGERRVIEAYTDVTVAGRKLVCRSSGQSTSHGANFVSSIDDGGAISQVQGMELPDGSWRVIYADGGGVKESTYTREQVRMSSLDLLDPGRTVLLTGGGSLGLLLVETGEIVTGTLDEGTTGTTKIAGQKVQVTRYSATGGVGAARFDVTGEGLLVKSELGWLGGTVTAAAQSVPAERSYGTVDTIETMSSGIEEDDL